MKRVLVFTSFYSPGFLGGGPIQSVANLTDLLNEHFKFYLLTKNYDLGNNNKPYNLPVNKWLNVNGVNVKYFTNIMYKLRVFSCLLDVKPSIIYFNSFFSSTTQLSLLYVRLYQLLGYTVRIIIAPRGEFDPGALSLSYTKKHYFLRFFSFLKHKDIVFHATSIMENENIKKIFPNNKITVAPNVPSYEQSVGKKYKIENESKFIFYSRITRKKNLIFVLNILRNLEVNGKLELKVVGPAEDQRYFQECLAIAKSMPENIHVTFIGPKSPIEIQNILISQHYLFFPTLGENYGHVIYESLSFGLPVIISTLTPWEGRGVENGVFSYNLENESFFYDTIKYLHSLGQQDYSLLSLRAIETSKQSFNRLSAIQVYLNMFGNE